MTGLVTAPARVAGGEVVPGRRALQEPQQSFLGPGLVAPAVQELGLQEENLLEIGVLALAGAADRQGLVRLAH